MRFASCLLLIFLLCGAAAAGAQTNEGNAPTTLKLSQSEAIRLAQARSATARGADARVAGAQARLLGANAFLNPALALAQPFGQNTGGLDEDILLTQTFELGDKRRQRSRAARAERDAALTERMGTAVDLAFNAQSAYTAALLSDVERNLASDALATAQSFAKTAQQQFDAGQVARSNVVRSKIEQTRAEQAFAAADTDRANRYAALRSLLEIPTTTTLELTDTLKSPPRTVSLPALQNVAMQNRSDVRAAQQTLSSRIALLHGTRVQSVPDLFIEGRRSTLDPSVGGSSVRIGITFPLADFGRNRADAKAAEASVREQQAILAELQRTARLEVETAFRTFEQARQTVQSFESGRLDQAKELQTMAQIGYVQRATTYLELLDAQQVYRTEQADYARALAAYQTALATLQRAVGGTLP